MTNENTIRFRRIYKIALSISIIIAGICLMTGCAMIYFAGDGYSAQIVADTFSKLWICIPVYLSLVLIVTDIVWEIIEPSDTKKNRNKKAINVSENVSNTNKKSKLIKLVVLTLAVAALVFGLFTGGYIDVLTKAVNICTECIGLG